MSLISAVSSLRPSSLKEMMRVNVEVNKIYGVVDFDGNGAEIPSSIYILGSELYIVLDSTDFRYPKETIISLVGVQCLEIKEYQMPHGVNSPTDPNFPAVLCITYLNDVFNQNSIAQINFITIRYLIEQFEDEVNTVVQQLKLGLNMSQSINNIHNKLRIRANSFDNEANATNQAQIKKSKFTMNGYSTIVSMPEIDHIRLFLPRRFRFLPWNLLYSAREDGVSLSTFYQKAEKKYPCLLIVLGDDGSRVGAFLPEGITIRGGYYGTGETFVFHFNPYFAGFRWSQRNDLFLSSSRKDIIIGGRTLNAFDKGSAIYINDNFMNCFSQDCETFNSPHLGAGEAFNIIAVELWHLHF